jgi:hypothetical protein
MIGYREVVAWVEFELRAFAIGHRGARTKVYDVRAVSTTACSYVQNKKFQLPFATSSPVSSGFDGEISNKLIKSERLKLLPW